MGGHLCSGCGRRAPGQKAYVTRARPDATVKSSLPARAVDVMGKKASAGNAQILKKASLQPV